MNMRRAAKNLALRRWLAPGRAGFLTAAAGALTLSCAAASEIAWQSPDSIRAAASAFVHATMGGGNELTVEAVGVDERLKLPVCANALQARAQGELRGGQGTVAVSCSAPQWKLFVPVRATRQVAVLIARRSLRAGERLTADDLVLATRSSGSLPYDYVASPEQAVGYTTRRSLPEGAVLVPAALEAARVIERGALVTLVSGGGAIAVTTEGVALAPAAAGQRVRVRSPSGRIVEGVVGASGEVRVGH